MLEVIKDLALLLILAGVCVIGAYILKAKKQEIRKIATDLIQKAEIAITGSGMGAEKKAKVIAQLQAMGIKVDAWLDTEIDTIVAYLNAKAGWLVGEAIDGVSDDSST